jgi:hypothetical protein
VKYIRNKNTPSACRGDFYSLKNIGNNMLVTIGKDTVTFDFKSGGDQYLDQVRKLQEDVCQYLQHMIFAKSWLALYIQDTQLIIHFAPSKGSFIATKIVGFLEIKLSKDQNVYYSKSVVAELRQAIEQQAPSSQRKKAQYKLCLITIVLCSLKST